MVDLKRYCHPVSAVIWVILLVLAIVITYFATRNSSSSSDTSECPTTVDMQALPSGFIMSCATASYQVEGAWDEDGKGLSIWDYFTHNQTQYMSENVTGDIACDSYHKYKEDVQMIKETGFSMYRFSISWSRILPTGYSNVTNDLGVAYYHNLIDELLANDIEPMVTLYHWDLPLSLEDIGGWTNPLIADLFANYSDVCFREYGSKVKYWITFNENTNVAFGGYGNTKYAPAWDDHGVSDYLAAHNLLRAHAKAYHLYDNTYRSTQNGSIGVTNYVIYAVPYNETSSVDQEAAERYMQFHNGVFCHPIFTEEGDYPTIMRERIDALSEAEGRNTSRLPTFTEQEIEDLKGSADFFGFNFYYIVAIMNGTYPIEPSLQSDAGVYFESDEVVYTPGIRSMLNWVKNEYNNPPIFITENGFKTNEYDLHDLDRIATYNGFLTSVLEAIYEDEVNILGYTAWSIMDNLEWNSGYIPKFGIWKVDFDDPDRTRTMKSSGRYFQNLTATRRLPDINDFS